MEKYDEQQKPSTNEYPKSLDIIISLLAVIVIVFGVAYLQGRYEAGNQKEFYVPSTNQNSLVLKIYGNDLICAPFEKIDNNEGGYDIGIDRKYFLINLNDNPNVQLIDEMFKGKVEIFKDPYIQN